MAWLRRVGVLQLLALMVAGTSPAAAAPVTEIHYVMGTYFSITTDDLSEPQARALMRGCFNETRRLEQVFSRYDPTSELSLLNARGESGPVEVSADLADLLARSLRLQALTAGTFDVTIGTLTPIRSSVSADARRAVAETSGQKRARFVAERRLIVAPGVKLDFDGIAKGYAVDRCAALLRGSGVQRALLSLGQSSQYAIGAPVGAPAWTVMVRDLSGNRALGTLALRDQALSVSSVLTRERHVAHIVDPRNGESLHEPAIAVVVTDSATEAEAWSKALLIGGLGNHTGPGGLPAALRITRRGVERLGSITFSPYDPPRAIGPDAEPFL